jgi:hypothetical protein
MGKQKHCNPGSRRWAYDRGANGVTDQTQFPRPGLLSPPYLFWALVCWGGLFWPPVSLALTQLNGPSMGSADVISPFWLDLPACVGFDSSLWVSFF